MSDGGPAFPQNDASVNRINNHDGMTLRDYFAGQALAGIIAHRGDAGVLVWTVEGTARDAYRLADEMLQCKAGWETSFPGEAPNSKEG